MIKALQEKATRKMFCDPQLSKELIYDTKSE